MGSESIKVDTKQLQTYSANIKTNYKNMYSHMAEADTAVKNLKSTWTGNGANEFYNRYNTLSSKAKETMSIVEKYAATLTETAQIYDTNEKKVTSAASKLKINLK